MPNKTDQKHTRPRFIFLLASLVALSLILGGTPGYGQAQKPLVDLNSASEKELESIKGVGPATAKKIIAARPYKSVEDLSKTGIPKKTVDGMKPFVKVSPQPAAATPPATAKPGTTPAPAQASGKVTPSKAASVKAAVPDAPVVKPPAKAAAPSKLAPGQKVNINSADKAQLEALPGIGPVKAQAIIDGRPYQKTDDIMKVKGIKKGTYEKIRDVITVN